MDMFHFVEFGKLKHVHHTINVYSGFQWATTLSSEMADLVIIHLLVVTAIMSIPAYVNIDNSLVQVAQKIKQIFSYQIIKYNTGKPYNPQVMQLKKEQIEL